MGEGSDSFAKDPPNATISVLSAEGDAVEDAVVVLKSPKLEGDKLTFEVTVLEGGLSKATGPASLFIDWFAARGYGGRGFVAGGGGWPAAMAADGTAPGTVIPADGVRVPRPSASASARRRSEQRPPARTTTPTRLSLLRAAAAGGLRLLSLSALLLSRALKPHHCQEKDRT